MSNRRNGRASVVWDVVHLAGQLRDAVHQNKIFPGQCMEILYPSQVPIPATPLITIYNRYYLQLVSCVVSMDVGLNNRDACSYTTAIEWRAYGQGW